MRNKLHARRNDAPDRQQAISAQFAHVDSADPNIGLKLVEQLAASIRGGELLSGEHRHLAAALRRNLQAQADQAWDMVNRLPARYLPPGRQLVDALERANGRAGDIEDALSHALVLGGILGELEQAIILRMLVNLGDNIVNTRAALIDMAMSGDWDDLGGPG